MSQSTFIKLQSAALDVANLALVPNVPATQFQTAVERYSSAKSAHKLTEGN